MKLVFMYITVASSASVSYAGKSYRDDEYEVSVLFFPRRSPLARGRNESVEFIACCGCSSW